MEFYSHPDMKLIVHLSQVKEYSLIYGNKEYSKINEIVACGHDFGKYTTYFQDRLFKREKGEKPEGNHAHISAVFTAYVMFNRGMGEGVLPLIAYNAVLSHHSRVKNFGKYLPMSYHGNKINKSDAMYWKLQILNKQKQNIKENYTDIYNEYKSLGFGEDFKAFMDDENSIEKTLILLRKKILLLYDEKDAYWIHQQIFSTLIASDKISASKIKPFEQKFIGYSELNKIREDEFSDKEKNEINNMRNSILKRVQENISKNYNKKVFSITAPTGSGKTMTGFFAALKLKELNSELKKVIYVLPYTSIIDQNYNDIRDLYIADENVKGSEYHYIMKHHHLSDYEKDRDDEIYNAVDYQTFMENWESGVIVTTFVQFLETAIGAKNKMLKKFYALKDSIVLMDEVQAVNIKYFELLNYVFTELAEELNCHIIIMTATKPLFFPKAFELLDSDIYENYCEKFNRTQIVCKLDEGMTLEGFCDYFSKNRRDKSYMIVVNTIGQSLELYKLIKETLENNNEYAHQLCYLSTNLIPKHRVERIDLIKKKLKSKEKVILVTTQVVEAGVNLDFDEVYRDIAPLDSIIQCAGRCNRNNRGFIGNVNLIKMVGEDGRTFGEKIYGLDTINVVDEILGPYEKVEEKDYLQLINEYYKKISDIKSQQPSKNFIKSIQEMNFDENDKWEVGHFSLIEENRGYLDVFIEYDEKAENLLKEYKNCYEIQDINERQKKFIPIRKEMQQYFISMPEKYWRTLDKFTVTPEYEILYIPRSGIGSYYDDMTGYKREEDDSMFFF